MVLSSANLEKKCLSKRETQTSSKMHGTVYLGSAQQVLQFVLDQPQHVTVSIHQRGIYDGDYEAPGKHRRCTPEDGRLEFT